MPVRSDLIGRSWAVVGGALSRNLLWNLAGAGLPMLATVIAVPILLHAIGPTRFGLLSLVWMIVGYFSLFDFGLGRTLTQIVAVAEGKQWAETMRTVWSAFWFMAAFGIAGGLLFAAVAPSGAARYLAIPQNVRREAFVALQLASAMIPLVVLTAGMRGLLEGCQRFNVVNSIRAPLGVLIIMAPVVALPFSHELPILIWALLLVRLIGCLAHVAACAWLIPELRRPAGPRRQDVRLLLTFGSWLTVSNIIGPMLMYSARIALAAMVSASSVAYFSTPNDIVINFLIIPSIVANVLYPRFAGLIRSDPSSAARLYRNALVGVAIATAPLALLAVTLAHFVIAWWISPDFADRSAFVCQLLAVGVFLNGFAFICEALVQSSGRPDLTAKLHIVEIVLYVPYTFFLIDRFGLIGAAISWIVRIAISGIGLFYLASRCLAGASRPMPLARRPVLAP